MPGEGRPGRVRLGDVFEEGGPGAGGDEAEEVGVGGEDLEGVDDSLVNKL